MTKSEPKFNVRDGRFLFHHAGHDTYWVVSGSGGAQGEGSLMAVFGNDGPDYASTPLRHFRELLKSNSQIGNGIWSMPYRDYLASEHCNQCDSCFVLAAAILLSEGKE